MYSGGIKKNFKIENLLKAFELLDDRFELWITGSGDFEKNVIEYADKNNKININDEVCRKKERMIRYNER